MARSLEDFHQNPRATTLLLSCASERPLFPPVLETASLLLRLQCRHNEARRLILDCMPGAGTGRGDPGLVAELGLVAAASGDGRAAARLFRRLARRQDAHAQAMGYAGLGWSHLNRAQRRLDRRGRVSLRRAEAAFGRALDKRPEFPDASLGLAATLLRQADLRLGDWEGRSQLHGAGQPSASRPAPKSTASVLTFCSATSPTSSGD